MLSKSLRDVTVCLSHSGPRQSKYGNLGSDMGSNPQLYPFSLKNYLKSASYNKKMAGIPILGSWPLVKCIRRVQR